MEREAHSGKRSCVIEPLVVTPTPMPVSLSPARGGASPSLSPSSSSSSRTTTPARWCVALMLGSVVLSLCEGEEWMRNGGGKTIPSARVVRTSVTW